MAEILSHQDDMTPVRLKTPDLALTSSLLTLETTSRGYLSHYKLYTKKKVIYCINLGLKGPG
jgi:hypothetical protein